MCLVFSPPAFSAEQEKLTDYVTQLDTLITNSTTNTDFLEAKLVIDKLIDPTVDVVAIRAEISKMVDVINGMIQTDATDWDKVTV